MDERQKKLSKLMHKKRKELNITQEKAAELLKVSAKWYQKVESGHAKPGFDMICEMAKEFEIRFNQFPEQEEKSS